MLGRIRQLIVRLLGIAVILGFLYIAYLGIERVNLGFGTLDTTVTAALVAALTGVFGYWYTQRQITTRTIAEEHRPNKVHLFEKFMDLFEEFQKMQEEESLDSFDPENPPEELAEKFREITRGLLIWGSPRLISAWLRYRRVSLDDSPNVQPLIIMDEVFQAFRVELGNSNSGLEDGDLIRLYLKDPDELTT